MGREIDLSQPLSAEDRAWLEERGKHGDLRVANELHPDSVPAEEVADPDDDGTEAGDEYGDWSKAQLAYELSTRDLPTTGTKAELSARLVKDDAARAAEDQGEWVDGEAEDDSQV